jgi:RNA polymerase sigma-70 factor, ECF subfamily
MTNLGTEGARLRRPAGFYFSGERPNKVDRAGKRHLTANEAGVNVATGRPAEAEIVGRIKAGEEAALVEVHARYRGRVFQVAMNVLRNESDAEEVANDVFACFWRNRARFRGDSSLATYLHRIAFNLALNRYQYRRRRRWQFHLSIQRQDEEGRCLSDTIAADEPSPARETDRAEYDAAVRAAIQTLQPAWRQALTLRAAGASYEQIAIETGSNIGTVKSRIARAREVLRQRVEQVMAAEPNKEEAA